MKPQLSRTCTIARWGKLAPSKKLFWHQTKSMASTTAQKLRIKEGTTILAINQRADYKKSLGPLPSRCKNFRISKRIQPVTLVCKRQAANGKRIEKGFALSKG